MPAMKPRRIAPKNEQLTEALQGELATYEQQGLYQSSVTKRSAYRYRGILVLYQRALGGAPPNLEVSKVFLAHLREQGYAPASLRLYRAVLKNFHKWRGEILEFPVKMPHHTPPYIEAKVVAAMLEFAKRDPRDYLILRLLSDAGLRREEAENLRLKNAVNGDLHIRGKGDKDRVVPMTEELARCLKAYCAMKKPDDLVLGVSGSAIYRAVKKYGRMAGKPEMKPHDLRHAFATRLLEKGVNIRLVQTLLGHADLNTTQIYIGVNGEQLRDAIKILGAGEEARLPQEPVKKALEVIRSLAEGDNRVKAASPGEAGDVVSNVAKLIRELDSEEVKFLLEFKGRLSTGIAWYGASEPVLEQLCIKRIVQLTQRREGSGRRTYDQSYWTLTDTGKKVIQRLEKSGE